MLWARETQALHFFVEFVSVMSAMTHMVIDVAISGW